MFSFNELKLVSYLLRISCKTCTFPLDWDSKTCQLHLPTSKLKPIVTYFLTIINFFYILFIVFRLYLDIRGITDPNGLNSNYRIFHVLFGLMHIIMCGVHLGSILHRDELIDFVNQLLYFNTESGKRFFGMQYLSHDRTKRRELWMNIFLFCLSTSALFLIIAYPLTRRKAYYVYSILPEDYQGIWTFTISYLLEIGFVLDTLLTMSIVQVLAYTYYVTTNFWLRKVCIEWPISNTEVRHSVRHLRLYQSLRLLNTLYNRVFSMIWIPTLKGTCTIFALLDLYGMVRLVDRLPTLIYLYLPVIYTFFVILFLTASTLMADVYHNSRVHLKHWVRHTVELGSVNPVIMRKRRWNSIRNGKKYFHIFLKSCRPLKCEVGPYFMQQSTKVTLISTLISGGITVLLTFE